MTREVNDDDIEELARRISEVQNDRFFDSRLKKIWELKQIDSESEEQSEGIDINDRIYASVDYYPNSRTTIGLFIEERFLFLKTIPDEGSDIKNTQSSSGIGININYYISPRVRLDVWSSINYDIEFINSYIKYSRTDFSYNFYASLVYKLL